MAPTKTDNATPLAAALAAIPAIELGANVLARVEGRRLILEIDLTQRNGESSGGNPVVCTTDGYTPFPGGPGLKLNCMIIEPQKKRK